MSVDTSNTTIKIIKGFEPDEADGFYEKLKESGYGLDFDEDGELSREEFDMLMNEEARFMELHASLKHGACESLEEFLVEQGMPYTRFSSRSIDTDAELKIFDGVRQYSVGCDTDGCPVVPMDALRKVIDLLEISEEDDPYADMRALVVANENWVETDINAFWRYGMESAVAFSPNVVNPNDGVIDVEIEEEDGGSPEITKKINS